MKIQNNPGIYAYFVDTTGLFTKKVQFYYFDTWKSFFSIFGNVKRNIEQFGDWDKIWFTCERNEKNYYWRSVGLAYYAVYDQDGRWFSPAYLIEKYGEIEKARKKRVNDYIHQRRHGRKKGAWGHYYAIKTARTNRNYFVDPDVEELGINVKYRSKANPPDSWDREKSSSMEKSWKCQSKREHQWKEHKKRD